MHGQIIPVPYAVYIFNNVFLRAFLTSLTPAIVHCQPSNLTTFSISSISLTIRSIIFGVNSLLVS